MTERTIENRLKKALIEHGAWTARLSGVTGIPDLEINYYDRIVRVETKLLPDAYVELGQYLQPSQVAFAMNYTAYGNRFIFLASGFRNSRRISACLLDRVLLTRLWSMTWSELEAETSFCAAGTVDGVVQQLLDFVGVQ